jgi:hypothetical protein
LEEITKYFDGEEKDIVELTNAQVKQAAAEGGEMERSAQYDASGKPQTATA